mmetsp:Transcript_70982/g.140954  ORF Transcript_70982/g.140954 Transcript_70982/m.140954 type:complete len:217 (-) Transcript_70982:293-943(-)
MVSPFTSFLLTNVPFRERSSNSKEPLPSGFARTMNCSAEARRSANCTVACSPRPTDTGLQLIGMSGAVAEFIVSKVAACSPAALPSPGAPPRTSLGLLASWSRSRSCVAARFSPPPIKDGGVDDGNVSTGGRNPELQVPPLVDTAGSQTGETDGWCGDAGAANGGPSNPRVGPPSSRRSNNGSSLKLGTGAAEATPVAAVGEICSDSALPTLARTL